MALVLGPFIAKPECQTEKLSRQLTILVTVLLLDVVIIAHILVFRNERVNLTVE